MSSTLEANEFIMKSLEEILTNQSLKNIVEKTQHIITLNTIWMQLPKNDWASQANIGSFNEGRLVLSVINGAFATRIRYAIPEITALLRTHPAFESLKEINCHILQEHRSNEMPFSPRSLPNNIHKLMADTAKYITYPPLKAILLRLGRNACEELLRPHS